MSRDPFTVPQAELATIVASVTSLQGTWEALGATCGCGGLSTRITQAIKLYALSTTHWAQPLQ